MPQSLDDIKSNIILTFTFSDTKKGNQTNNYTDRITDIQKIERKSAIQHINNYLIKIV